MAETKQMTDTGAITLQGSAELVAEFFSFGINSILYQRGIYPEETFRREVCYGIPMVVTDNKELSDYISNVLDQVKAWLLDRTIQKLVLVITSIETGEDLERWQFDVKCDKSISADGGKAEKPVKIIRKEIQDVIRQIVSTVTFLPLLEDACSFDVLIYTDKDSDVPVNWEESNAHLIANSQAVRLKSFSSLIHKVDAMVAYKTDT